jgi:transcriptional regulator with XRE-family HTH domain
MKNKPETYNSPILDALFQETSSKESRKIEKRMLLAAKIDDAIKAKGWKQKHLLEALGKENPSIISKWLSGTHNFTTDTLFELEEVLDITLVDLEEKPKEQVASYKFEIVGAFEVPNSSYRPGNRVGGKQLFGNRLGGVQSARQLLKSKVFGGRI